MIFKLEFSPYMDHTVLRDFFKNPKGTCLDSSSARNITPSKIQKEKGQYLTFWFIDDHILVKYYGEKVCINSLCVYPDVKSISIIYLEKKISLDDIKYRLSEEDLYSILHPYVE